MSFLGKKQYKSYHLTSTNNKSQFVKMSVHVTIGMWKLDTVKEWLKSIGYSGNVATLLYKKDGDTEDSWKQKIYFHCYSGRACKKTNQYALEGQLHGWFKKKHVLLIWFLLYLQFKNDFI